MSEIVVGVDCSAASRRAMTWAMDRSAHTGARVIGAHAWSIPVAIELPVDPLTTASLMDSLGHTSAGADRPITFAALSGDAGPALVDRAREAELLVVGARQAAHGLRASVASYCLRHSHTPVAVVPDVGRASATRRPRLVVVGVDLTAESAVALRWANEAASAHGAELAVAYAWQAPIASVAQLAHHAGSRNTRRRRACDELQDWVERVLPDSAATRVQLRAEHGSPLDTLLALATRADMLVLGSHGHHPLARMLGGSLSGQLALLSSCPVVVTAQPGALQETGA